MVNDLLQNQNRAPVYYGIQAQSLRKNMQNSLIQQLAPQTPRSGEEAHGRPQEDWDRTEQFVCADGYLRKTPIQEYKTSKAYLAQRRRRIQIIAGTVLVILAVMAILVIRLR